MKSSLASETISEKLFTDTFETKSKRRSPVKDLRTVPSSQEERASRYYNLREENGILKEKLHDYENEIKKMATNLMRLQAQVTKGRKSKVDPVDSENIDGLLKENKELKDRMRRTDAVLKSMHVSLCLMRGRYQGTKAICKAKHGGKKRPLSGSKTISTGFHFDPKDRIIDKLASQLKEMNTQLYSITKGKPMNDSILGEKDRRVQQLEQEYSELERTLKERDITHQTNKEMLDKALSELQERRVEILKLQTRLVESEFASNRAKELQKESQELSLEINQLQTRITELAMSPFVKDAEGRYNYVKKLQEAESEVRELESEYANIIEEAEKYEFENKQLAQEIQETKENTKKAKESVEELKNGFSKESAGRLLSANTAEEFKEIMATMTKQGNAPSWAKVDFLPSRPKEDPADPQFLLHEIERLTLEKGQLAAELEKGQALKEAKEKIDVARMSLEQKIYELERKVDLPNPRASAALETVEYPLGKTRVSPMKVPEVDGLTEFSESQVSDLPPKSNILDLLLADCTYYDRQLMESTGMTPVEVSQLNSLVEVAFYNHDVKYSPARPGLMPKYTLQVSFQVDVDDAFLKHMEEGEIEVTCMYINESVPKAFGKAFIPLRDVVDRILHSTFNVPAIVTKAVSVFGLSADSRTEQKVIGQLRYKLRMRFDMLQDLKEYKTRTEYRPAARIGTVSSIIPSEVRTYNIRVVKCERLRTKEMSRVLAPFVYYSFYKFWHATKTMAGTEPEFDEAKTFDVAMSAGFIEYLQSAPMEIVVFDDRKSQSMRVRDASQGPPGEVIGRAHIRLAEVLEQQQGEKRFVEELKELEGEEVVGRVEVWISWNTKKATGANWNQRLTPSFFY
eukprot:TRINITY_DN2498_c0_g1_i1.p1 TRINITY_DN2498_c0_g1~~TRINITY_DN2498_c0_g1_i1.p1  ORF type:complete len:856 (-),score=117.93 TRINITY_DN2498_c0_g1_i1:69-2636(-)